MRDELLTQFLIEAPDLVQQGSDAVMALEQSPGERAHMDDAFRAFHTLKGSVGLFDLPAMARILHAAEDVLDAIRSGRRAVDPPTIDALMAVLSHSERWLTALEETGGLPADTDAIARKLAERLNLGVVAFDKVVSGDDLPDWAVSLRDECATPDAATAIRYTPHEGSYFSGDDPAALLVSLPGLVHLRLGLGSDRPDAAQYDPFACRLILEAVSSASASEVRAVLRFVPDQVEVVALPLSRTETVSKPADRDASGLIRTLRVDAERVESLAAMVDQLIAARTALSALSSMANSGASAADIGRRLKDQADGLDRLTGRIHQQVTDLRMTPISPLFGRFPRVARELARSLHREVDLVIEDNGIEADKTIIEGLFDPLTHLVRNAIDHGIQPPAQREAAGKARKGTVWLSASTQRGRLEVTLADDGQGLDPALIRKTVSDKGLMSPETVSAMDDAQAGDLIFLPGFSTAQAVTDVSGRGVGMDAVKTAVQHLGGQIRVENAPGHGVTFHISLPLSLTLTKVLIVISGGERYGVPMDRVVETLRLTTADITNIRAGQAFNWRNRTVPLVSLASLIGIEGAQHATYDKVLVIQSGKVLVGVAVDAIMDRADVTVRPLQGLLAGLPGISGSTLSGDGRVVMILDLEALVE